MNLSIQPIFDNIWLVLLFVAALGALLLVRPGMREPTTLQNRTLTGLRIVVILLIIIALLRPTNIRQSTKPQTAILIVLLDTSSSMNEQAAAGSQTRWQQQIATLQSNLDQMEDLKTIFDIKFYQYNSELGRIEHNGSTWDLPNEAEGTATDLFGALHESIEQELGKRLAGVILLGDGMQTAVNPDVDATLVTSTVSRLGAPLFSVAFGQSNVGLKSKDVAIEKLPQDHVTYVKNEIIIRAMVRIRGYVNQEIPVNMEVVGANGEKETIGPKSVSVRDSNDLVRVEFPYVPQTAGQYTLTVKADVQAGESIKENNALPTYLNVREGGLLTYYLYGGSLMGEQQELRRAIHAAPDMEVDAEWIAPASQKLWPLDRVELANDPNYDVFIIENVPYNALTPDTWAALANRVFQGKGLIMIGGHYSFGPGGFAETPVADLLPVEMGRLERQDLYVNRPIRKDVHYDGRQRDLHLEPAKLHPLTRLSSPTTNNQVWAKLTPLIMANRFTALKNRANILVQSRSGYPMLVSGEYGGGRVLAFAGSSTWQWRRRGFGKEHRRFWRQIILWLSKRDNREEDDVWLELDRRRLDPTTPLTFRFGARDTSGEVLTDVNFAVLMTAPDGTKSEVRTRLNNKEWSGQTKLLTQDGEYFLRVVAERQGQTIGEASAPFRVISLDPEKSNPAADPDQLARLAKTTERWGGRLVAPEELTSLLDELAAQKPELEVKIQEKWQFADGPISAWLFLMVVSAVLGSEWYIRKRWGLV